MRFAAFAFIATVSLVAVTTAVTVQDGETEHESIFTRNRKCVLNEISNTTKVAKQFISNVKDCNVVLSENEHKAMNATHKMVDAANEISRIYQETCKDGEHVKLSCRRKMSKPIINFVANVVETVKAIAEAINAPRTIGSCVWNAARITHEDLKEFRKDFGKCIFHIA